MPDLKYFLDGFLIYFSIIDEYEMYVFFFNEELSQNFVKFKFCDYLTGQNLIFDIF